MDYQTLLEKDPGNRVFVEHADNLHKSHRDVEAVDTLLRGLSVNPSFHEARLLLAEIFYEKGYVPFAVQELRTLRNELPQLKSIHRLLEELSPESLTATDVSSEEETFAESEFDVEALDLDDDSEKA